MKKMIKYCTMLVITMCIFFNVIVPMSAESDPLIGDEDIVETVDEETLENGSETNEPEGEKVDEEDQSNQVVVDNDVEITSIDSITDEVKKEAKVGEATTYYVDANQGNDANVGTSSKQAWKTLDKINTIQFTAGDKVLFRAGTVYTGMFSPKGSGSAQASITVDMYEGDTVGINAGSRPKIQANGEFDQAVYLENQNYWTIKNLEITNTGPYEDTRMGVYIIGTNRANEANNEDEKVIRGIHLDNLYVHDVNGNWKKDSVNGGIYFSLYGDKLIRFEDILVENCYVKDVSRTGISVGFTPFYYEFDVNAGGQYLPGVVEKFAHKNVVIRNNYVERSGGDAIVTQFCDRPLVEYNISNGAAQINAESGRKPANAAIWPWHCYNSVYQFNEAYGTIDNQDGQAYDADYSVGTIYQYNYSHDNGGGFLMICLSDAFGTIARYNISQNDRKNVFLLSGPEGEIYNNTVYIGEGLATNMVNFEENVSGKRTKIRNNIFYNAGTVKNPTWYAEHAINGDSLNYDNNLYYGYDSLPYDNNPIVGDPLFVDPGKGKTGVLGASAINTLGGYALKSNSPAINKGLVINGDNGGRDYFGTPLTDGMPDIGAYESTVVTSEVFLFSAVYSVNQTSKEITIEDTKEYTKIIENISATPGATLEIIKKDGGKVTSGTLNEDMKIVVSKDGTSKEYTIKLVTVPVEAPRINAIYPGANSKISGTGPAGKTVVVTFPGGSTLTTVINTYEQWEVTYSGKLSSGETVAVIAKNLATQEESIKVTRIVEEDAGVTIPELHEMFPGVGIKITGTGPVGKTIVVVLPDLSELTTAVRFDGTWEVKNPGTLIAGQTVQAYSKDMTTLEVSERASQIVMNLPAVGAPKINEILSGTGVKISGTGSIGKEISVTFPDATVLTTTVKPNATWEVTFSGNLVSGDMVTATAKDKTTGGVSPIATKIVSGNVGVAAPVVNNIQPGTGVKVNGTGPIGTEISVMFPDTTKLTAIVAASGEWEVQYPGKLVPGDSVSVFAKDILTTQVSSTVKKNVSDYPSIAVPTVNEIKPGTGMKISGTGPIGKEIIVTLPDSTKLNATVGAEGTWEVTVVGKLLAKDMVKVIAKDTVTLVESSVVTKVVSDCPSVAAPTLAEVKPGVGSVISGTGVAGKEIIVTLPDTTKIKATVEENGTWKVTCSTKLIPGETISVIAKDKETLVESTAVTKKVSEYNTVAAPTVNDIKPGTNVKIKGTGLVGKEIIVSIPDATPLKTTVDASGNWEVTYSGKLLPKTIVSVIAKDKDTLVESKATTKTVGEYPTVEKPTINEILPGTGMKMSGTGPVGKEIIVTIPDAASVTATVGADGKWEVTYSGKLLPGTMVSVVAKDKDTLVVSEAVTKKVSDYNIVAAPTVNEIKPGTGMKISGTGSVGKEIIVTIPEASPLTATVGADEKWEVTYSGKLLPGTVVSVIAKDKVTLVESAATTKTVSAYPVVEKPTVNEIKPGTGMKISGTGPVGKEIIVTIPEASPLTATVGADEKWEVTYSGKLLPGTVVSVIAKDKVTLVESAATTKTVSAYPVVEKPTVNEIKPGTGMKISGTGPVGKEIIVTIPDATPLTATVGAEGKWEVTYTGKLLPGTTVSVVAKDKVTLVESTAVTKKVSDYITVAAPTVNEIKPGTGMKISGTGPIGKEIIVTIPDATPVTATVGAEGKWEVTYSGKLLPGTTVSVIAKDKDTLVESTAVTKKVSEYITVAAPTVNEIKPGTGIKISGTGPVGKEIIVTIPDATPVTATVGADGKWEVTYSGKLLPGTIISVIAKDKDTLVESAAVTKIVSDYITVAAPTVNEIKPGTGMKISGTGPVGKEIIVTIPDVAPLKATVGASGNWEVTYTGKLLSGTTVSVIAKDKDTLVESLATIAVVGSHPSVAIPTVNEIEPGTGSTISGTGTIGMEIVVTIPSATKSPITLTAIVGASGTWEVTYTGKLLPGTMVSIIARDTTTLVESAVETKVVRAYSTIEAPTVNEINPGTGVTISGTGPVGMEILVTLPDATILTTTVEADGTWKVVYSGELLPGATVSIIARDTTTLVESAVATKTVRAYPTLTAPTVNEIKAGTGVTISGTGVVGAEITVTLPSKTKLTAIVEADGTWKVTYLGELLAGDVLSIVAKDPVTLAESALVTKTVGGQAKPGVVAPSKPVDSNKPATGDATNMGALLALLGASFIVLCKVTRKKEQN